MFKRNKYTFGYNLKYGNYGREDFNQDWLFIVWLK